MDTINVELRAANVAMLMHSDRLSNPLDKLSIEHKKLTAIRPRTDEVHLAIARSEYEAGLYFDSEMGPFIPGQNLLSALREGAKFSRHGAAVTRGVQVLGEKFALEYEGPRDMDTLWATPRFVDARSVVVQRSRVTRYRPRFEDWTCQVGFVFDTAQIERDQFLNAFEQAGQLCGVGDYRPLFGRFTVKEI